MAFNSYDYKHLYALGRELLSASITSTRRKAIGVELMDLAEQVVGQLGPATPSEQRQISRYRGLE